MRRLAIALLALFVSVSAHAATLLPNGKQCFSAVNGTTGMVGLLGTITGGSLYTTGTYGGVPLTGSATGTLATATIVVSGGAVTSVTILNPGKQYIVGDVLTASAANIGGTGSGFSVPVSSVSINGSLAGGQVFMYIPSTTTTKPTYQDAAQTILNSNPIILDANGCAIIYGIGTYRQLLEDSLGNTIWDQLTTDTSASNSVFWAGNAAGTPNAITLTDAGFNGTSGSVILFVATATNTGAMTINPSSFGNVTLQKITSLGPATMAAGDVVTGNIVEVVYNSGTNTFQLISITQGAAASASAIFSPQGYLTLTSGTPVIASDVVAATSVYYTPFVGNQIPIWNGSIFVAFTFSELTLTLTGTQTANTIYDLCVFSNAGNPVLVAGPAWSNSATGAGSRGSGAGTPQLQRINGLWTNAVQITGNNGASSFTIAANQCTYVGSIYTDNTGGQVTAHRSYGQNRKFGVSNAYNRVPIIMQAGDPTGSWTYGSGTVRASNNVPAAFASGTCNVGSGTACNGIMVFNGLPEEEIDISFTQSVNSNTGSATSSTLKNGIGFNSITAYAANSKQGTDTLNCAGCGGVVVTTGSDLKALYVAPPSIGINAIICLESSPNNTGNNFNGQAANMMLLAKWRG